MKKTLTIVSVALVALILSSCVENSKKYQALLAEKQAVEVQKADIENQYNAAIGIINDVENNLQAIRDAEGILLVQQEGSTQREQIVSELLQIKEVMAVNRMRLDSLNNVLEKSNKTASNLRYQIKKLQAQIEEKDQMIADLQNTIAAKDQEIAGLNTQVAGLSNDLNNANATIEKVSNEKTDVINEMNQVYYINATKKQLKEMGILNKKEVLKQSVPTEKFTKADKRELNEITYEARKAVVLSSHPASSYTLVKGEGTFTLQITDPDAFWSVTKYLVVFTK
ncbi:MAG: hypothetical protein MJZ85_01115 [Bacteroidales bacterium]|nr:hypothetical protein [Bacteroidales bacterium]